MLEQPPPGPRRSRRALAVALVAAAAVLAAAVAVAVTRAGDDDAAARPASTTTTVTAAPPEPTATSGPSSTVAGAADPPDELTAAVAELSRFVEESRGLRFRHAVEVELLDGDAFVERLLDDVEEDREDIETDERVLKALRLIPDDVDLFDAFTSVLDAGVVGFYDPETGELVVRGARLSPYVRSTLVHELVHALDDQHFELHRPELEDVDDERQYAFSGLYEGNATRIEDAWRQTLSDDEEAQLRREELAAGQGIATGSFPEYLLNVLAFPYVFGEELVAALVEEGGERRLDQAFSQPPSTTEHVMHPEAYLRGEGGARVAPPAAGGDVVDQGAVGQWVLFLLLGQEIGQAEALRAADGWGGDWYVAWDESQRTCVRSRFVMDSRPDLDELVDALGDWASGHGAAEVESDASSVTFTACG